MFTFRRHAFVLAAAFTVTSVLSGCAQPVETPDLADDTDLAVTSQALTKAAGEAFVSGLFVDLLGRPASAAECAVFAGKTRHEVVDAVLDSIEYRAHRLRKMYVAYLGTQPTQEVIADAVASNVEVEQWEQAILLSSTYFTKAGKSGATWVANVYKDVLGRTASDAEIALFANRPRPEVVAMVQSSTEARCRIIAQVYGLLGLQAPRDPSVLLKYWKGERWLIDATATSQEYAMRFM